MAGIQTRVARVAEANVDRWTKGRFPALDRCAGVDETKTAAVRAEDSAHRRERDSIRMPFGSP